MNMTTVPSNQLKAMQHEIESLKEQVAYLEELNRKLCDKANQLTIMDARAGETVARQAAVIEQMQKSIQMAAEQIRKCDYTPARSTLLCAMKDFK